jgi:AraC-like DNA-binding protein
MTRLQDREVLILDLQGKIGAIALPPAYRAGVLAGWHQLLGRLPTTSPDAVLLVDPYTTEGKADHRFWEMLERFPSLTVVAAVDVTSRRIVDLRRMALAGISETWNLRLSYPPALAAALLDSTCARPLKRRLEPHLSRFVSGTALILLRAAAEVAVRRGGAHELAGVFGVSRATVSTWCEAAALPPPRRLQLWMRVLLAAQLLQDAGRTIRDAAAACGYSTDRSLRRVMNQLLGSDTRTVRGDRPFEAAARAFNEELRSLREHRTRVRAQPARIVVPMKGGETQQVCQD